MDPKPVFVGVDGSLDSAWALGWAAEYARRYEAPLHALITWEIPPVYGYPAVVGQEEFATRLEEQSRNVLHEPVRETLGVGAQFVKRVERGHPTPLLVAASKAAQLLVVGSRGLGAFRGMLLGSVSQHCISHAQCPVVVMPNEDVNKP